MTSHVDVAVWLKPAPGSLIGLVIKLLRKSVGQRIGLVGKSVVVKDPDNCDGVATFAAPRAKDGALTVMAINKDPDQAMPVSFALARTVNTGTVRSLRLAHADIALLSSSRYSDAARPTLSAQVPQLTPDAR